MTILLDAPNITGVLFEGLNNLNLPFTSHIFEADDDTHQPGRINDDAKYWVKNVTGLEPPGRSVAIARTASGGRFQGVTVEDREVVVLIGLQPDWDAGETPKLLRDNLYTMINTGYDPKVLITLIADGGVKLASVPAYVTQFEAALFSKDPAVQITFTCLNPTFKARAVTKYPKSALSEKAPDIYNFGTAETGFQFAVKFTDTKNGWFIKQAENQNIGMEFDMVFHENDVLSVSTIPGQRYVHWQKRRGRVQNMISILKYSSEWIQLHPGHNHFVVPKKTTTWDWKGDLSFTARYWGA